MLQTIRKYGKRNHDPQHNCRDKSEFVGRTWDFCTEESQTPFNETPARYAGA
jgi:YHS domain-containing protein